MDRSRNSTGWRMSRVKSRHTSLEKRFALLLKSNGIKYWSQPPVYGHPDFRIKSTKLLVFCDSSFWHGRNENELNGKAFKTNRSFWTKKLQYNKERDEKTNRILMEKGWLVVRFWDRDILKKSSFVISRLKRYVEKASRL